MENFLHQCCILHTPPPSPPHPLTHAHMHTYSMEQKCSEVVSSVERDIEDQCEHWVAELESGGNMKFTAGDPSLPWYKSCSDLTTSRFSVADVEVCVHVCVCVCVHVCACMCVCVCMRACVHVCRSAAFTDGERILSSSHVRSWGFLASKWRVWSG